MKPSLLKGHPYVPACRTDIRKTIRREQKRPEAERAQQAEKVSPINLRKAK